jgi:hypothetical protein
MDSQHDAGRIFGYFKIRPAVTNRYILHGGLPFSNRKPEESVLTHVYRNVDQDFLSEKASYDQRFWLMKGKQKEREDYNQQSKLEEREEKN